MLKKCLLIAAAFIATMGFAFAQVDVNKADQAALDSVKHIGPKMSKAIIDERKKNGEFKDWADLEKRVKGIGSKNSDRLSQAGLTVNGQAKSGVATKEAKQAKKAVKADAKETGKQAKADAKDAGKDMKKEEAKK